MSRGQVTRALPAVLLITCAVASFAGHAHFFRDPTTPQDWKAAAQFVSDKLPDQTTIRVEPHWSDAPLVHLTKHRNRIDRRSRLIPEDRFGEKGAWVIAETDRVDDAAKNAGPDVTVANVTAFGSVSVVELNYPSHYTWNARQNLDKAVVRRVQGNKVETCSTWDENDRRWDCGRRDKWTYVRDMVKEVGDEPRSCIFMHPIPGKTVQAVFDVPSGKNLRVRAGIDLRAARSARGTDVTFRVVADDKTHTQIIPHDSQEWFALDVPLNGPQKVAFEVETPKVHDRFFCFDAWLEP